MSMSNKRNYPLKSQVCDKDSCNSDMCPGNQHKYQRLLPVIKYSTKQKEKAYFFLIRPTEQFLILQPPQTFDFNNKYYADVNIRIYSRDAWGITIPHRVIHSNTRYFRLIFDNDIEKVGHVTGVYRKENIFYFFDSSLNKAYYDYAKYFFSKWSFFKDLLQNGFKPFSRAPLKKSVMHLYPYYNTHYNNHQVINVSKRFQKQNDFRCYKHACDWLLNRAKSNNAGKKREKVSFSHSGHQQKSKKK